MAIRIEVVLESDVSKEQHEHINQWYRKVFSNIVGGVGPDGIEWGGDNDDVWQVLVYEDDVWGGIAEVIKREIAVAEQTVIVGGIGGVMTLPDFRGHGLGKAAMEAAAEFICKELKVDIGMLYCGDRMVGYYAALGWQLLRKPHLTYHQSDGAHRLSMEQNVMVLPCHDFVFPHGEIDVKGKLW